MSRITAKWLALMVAGVCTGLNAADRAAAPGRGATGLPASVLTKTREQLLSYLGENVVRGLPLLDPSIDWNSQSNWPDRFVYRGRSCKLEVHDLSGDEPKPVRGRAAVKPGTPVVFSYSPIGAVTNGIFPGATWIPGKRIPAKILIWGNHEFGGPWKTVFSYSFYPNGGLREFYWQARDSDNGNWEIFDGHTRLVGVKSPNGCFWNGAKVSQTEFDPRCRNLQDSGGLSDRTPVQPTTRPNAAPPQR